MSRFEITVIPANGQIWKANYVREYAEVDGGIQEKIVSVTDENGRPITLLDGYIHVFYEDETGLYITSPSSSNQPALRIKYPLTVGEKFQSGGNYANCSGLATIKAINETVTTAAGVFENVIVVSYEYGEGGYGEEQYFAPGVGLVKSEAVRSEGVLVNIRE